MTIICAAEKNGEICIAADTQTSFGSTKITSKYMISHEKLHRVGDSVIGVTGWCAIALVVEHLTRESPEKFKLDSRSEIFESLLALQKVVTDEYFVDKKHHNNQPVDSNHIDGIIVNKTGIYRIGSYREVHQYSRFCAVGSGQRLALGAMHALYEEDYSAEQIVLAGATAAAEFDDGCSLPVLHHKVFMED